MEACEVLNLLRASRPTSNYLKQGFIDAVKLPNGRDNYVEKSVYGYAISMYSRRRKESVKKKKEEFHYEINL